MEENIRFNSLFCANDRSFFMEICAAGKRIMITRIMLTYHRVNVSGSLVKKRASHMVDCSFQSYRICEEMCNRRNVSENVRFEILDHELLDIFRWIGRYCREGIFTREMLDELNDFIRTIDYSWFAGHRKGSQWIKKWETMKQKEFAALQ